MGSKGRQSRRGAGNTAPALVTRKLKYKKLRRSKLPKQEDLLQPPNPPPGQKVVVETLMTTSYADVVWQVTSAPI